MKIKVEKALVLIVTFVLVNVSIFPVLGSENDKVFNIDSAPVSSRAQISVDPGICGPIDLAIVLDNTGSMGGAINNIKLELPNIIATANTASGGDLRVGFITFRNEVTVHNNLTTNISAVNASIQAEFAGGGGDSPEPADEAKNTTINNLPAGTRHDVKGIVGTQIGDFTTPWRADAKKIAVIITDAPVNGFGEGVYPSGDPAYNINMNTTLPAQAAAKGILFSDIFVPTGGDYAGQVAVLGDDANKTGGMFIMTAANGSGTGNAITSIVSSCGGVQPKPVSAITPIGLAALAGLLGLFAIATLRRRL